MVRADAASARRCSWVASVVLLVVACGGREDPVALDPPSAEDETADAEVAPAGDPEPIADDDPISEVAADDVTTVVVEQPMLLVVGPALGARSLALFDLADGSRLGLGDGNDAFAGAIAPDGRNVIATTADVDRVLLLFELATGKHTELDWVLPPGTRARGIAWAPDANRFATFADSDEAPTALLVADLRDQSVEVVLEPPAFAGSLTWADESTLMISQSNPPADVGSDGLYLVDLANGALRPLITMDEVFGAPRDGAWSPDGGSVAITIVGSPLHDDPHDAEEIRRRIQSGEIGIEETSPGPDVFVIGADGRITARLSATPNLSEQDPTWTHDGRVVFVFEKRTVVSVAPDGGDEQPLLELAEDIQGVTFAPGPIEVALP